MKGPLPEAPMPSSRAGRCAAGCLVLHPHSEERSRSGCLILGLLLAAISFQALQQFLLVPLGLGHLPLAQQATLAFAFLSSGALVECVVAEVTSVVAGAVVAGLCLLAGGISPCVCAATAAYAALRVCPSSLQRGADSMLVLFFSTFLLGYHTACGRSCAGPACSAASVLLAVGLRRCLRLPAAPSLSATGSMADLQQRQPGLPRCPSTGNCSGTGNASAFTRKQSWPSVNDGPELPRANSQSHSGYVAEERVPLHLASAGTRRQPLQLLTSLSCSAVDNVFAGEPLGDEAMMMELRCVGSARVSSSPLLQRQASGGVQPKAPSGARQRPRGPLAVDLTPLSSDDIECYTQHSHGQRCDDGQGHGTPLTPADGAPLPSALSQPSGTWSWRSVDATAGTPGVREHGGSTGASHARQRLTSPSGFLPSGAPGCIMEEEEDWVERQGDTAACQPQGKPPHHHRRHRRTTDSHPLHHLVDGTLLASTACSSSGHDDDDDDDDHDDFFEDTAQVCGLLDEIPMDENACASSYGSWPSRLLRQQIKHQRSAQLRRAAQGPSSCPLTRPLHSDVLQLFTQQQEQQAQQQAAAGRSRSPSGVSSPEGQEQRQPAAQAVVGAGAGRCSDSGMTSGGPLMERFLLHALEQASSLGMPLAIDAA